MFGFGRNHTTGGLAAACVCASVAFGVVLTASPVHACSGVIQLPDFNKAIQVEEACSFQNAGKATRASVDSYGAFKYQASDNTRGAAVVDRGEDIVSQVVTEEAVCYVGQLMLILDCNADEAIALHGIEPPTDADAIVGFAFLDVKYAIGKEGKVNLYRGETLPDFTTKARKAGLKVTSDVQSLQSGWKRKDKYDAFCGCKLYYPVSAGAKK